MTMTNDTDPILSVFGKLHLTLDRLSAATEAHTKEMQRVQRMARADETPHTAKVQGQGTIGAGGEGVICFDGGGGPAQGYEWHVRRLLVGSGLSIFAAVAGRADVFVTANGMEGMSDPAVQQGYSGWSDTTSTLPSIAFYGENEMKLVWPEKLFVVISGGTVGDKRFASAVVLIRQEASRVQVDA